MPLKLPSGFNKRLRAIHNAVMFATVPPEQKAPSDVLALCIHLE